MPMLEDDLVALIVADGNGTAATDLFKGDLPPSPDQAVVVSEYQGTGPDTFFNTTSINEHPRVQIKVRGVPHDRAAVRNRIEKIYQAFDNRGAFVTAGGTRYLNIESLHPPFPMEQDKNQRWVFVVNFAVIKERSATT